MKGSLGIELIVTFLHNLYVENLDVFFGFLFVHSGVLDLMDNIQALNRPSKDSMLVIKPWLFVN